MEIEASIKDHAALAEAFIKDEERVDWHDGALWYIREKRDIASKQIPEWEALREAASEIKSNVISNLHDYLLQFESKSYKKWYYSSLGRQMRKNITKLYIRF